MCVAIMCIKIYGQRLLAEGSASESDPLGSGSNGLKLRRRDILTVVTHVCAF